MDNINRYIKIFVLILIPALCWLSFNSIYYRHLHKLSTGLTISHAHPFDKAEDCSSSPFASHNHTEDEYVLYDIISDTLLLIVIAAFASILFFEKLINKFLLLIKERFTKSYFYLLQEYRGPPYNF